MSHNVKLFATAQTLRLCNLLCKSTVAASNSSSAHCTIHYILITCSGILTLEVISHTLYLIALFFSLYYKETISVFVKTTSLPDYFVALCLYSITFTRAFMTSGPILFTAAAGLFKQPCIVSSPFVPTPGGKCDKQPFLTCWIRFVRAFSVSLCKIGPSSDLTWLHLFLK